MNLLCERTPTFACSQWRPHALRTNARFGRAQLLLTVREVAERLGCGRTFVYELISTGELETVKLGRLRRVPVAAVDALVERHKASARGD